MADTTDATPNTTLAEVTETVEKVGVLAETVSKVLEFFIHCFRCKNENKTKTLVKRDSVEVRRTRNAYRASGTCEKCGANVSGFIPYDEAVKLGYTPSDKDQALVPKSEPAKKRRRTTTAKVAAAVVGDSGPDREVVAEVVAVAPESKE